MAGLHLLPARLIRWTSLFVCLALLLTAFAGIPFHSASSKESTRVRPQEQAGNERRVAPLPPRTGPPAPNLPNLDEVKHRQVQAPRAAAALPSTIRSRRKPLESRNGRRVGDPLPPRVRPTPVPTPSGLPTPTPRSEELATTLRGRLPILLASLLRQEPFGFVPFVITSPDLSWLPLSDSSAPLFMFDVTAPPVPQAGGSKIVFASSRDGFMQIYVMNSDGTGQTRLTTDGSNNENPRWSPDGAKILFQSDRDNPGSGLRDIYVMNSNGSGQTRLTTDTNDDCFPSWSSDGTKIVFQSFRNGVNYQIYTMNADGSGQINISNNAVNDTQPSWSPAGKIAFASDRDQPAFPSIYWMNTNGTNQTRLTFSGTGLRDEQPVWSPNGTKLAFISTRDSVLENWQETDDYEIPEDDGQLFNKSRLQINKEVYVMDPDGTSQMRLTFALENDDSPCWSPDGTKIVFRSERERDLFDATPQIWTMNADGTGQTNLSNSGDSDLSPSWTSGSANQSPVANAGGPYSGVVGQNAPFNGSGSYDPDGTIVSYSWTFSDGGTGSGVAPTHAYGTTGIFNVTLTVTDNLGAQASASTTISVSASTSDQYAMSFLQWALGRPPNGEESAYWTDVFRAAYPKGLSSMKLATRELGMTVFESAEYAARNRNDHWYVYDLYKTYLMREPDAEGWANWEAAIPIYGRDQIRRGFDESTEFANIVATLNASGSPSSNVSSLATARVDPFNQSGNQLQARDAEWSANLLSLPGRAGLDLGLSISYSSLVFTRSGPYNYFDADNGSPSPGFHIGFPTIQDKYFDAQVGANVYLLKTAAGRTIELRQIGTSNVYESADSSYLQLIYSGNLLLRTTDGTQMTFGWTGLNEYRCIEIKDRNGNYIAVNYDWRGDIQNVTDTLGRVITFNYDTNANLNTITQSWTVNGVPQTHTWASFGWDTVTMQPTLTGVVGAYSGEVIPVLKMVGFHDATYVKFLYNGNGQVRQITQYASDSNPLSDNHPRNYTVFDYDSATNDCPRLNSTRTWAEYWTGFNGVPTEVTTQFGVEGAKHTVTVLGDPNGTVYKESYAGSGAPAWQRGLVLGTEVWAGSAQRKVSTLAWSQDNTNVNYKTNPRVTETVVSDGPNTRKTTIDYSVAAYAQYGLPYFVTEYAADGTTEIRRTYRDYNLSQAYLDYRIIGLVSAVHLTSAGGYQSKVTYGYDDTARLTPQATNATMHDQSYNSTFAARGNVTSVSRWDVTNMNTIVDPSKALTTFMNYNAAGSVVSTTDPSGHTSTINYLDSFSDGNNSRNTFAYPTTLTDADGFSSVVQYNFDFGGKTRIEGPPPQNQPNGAIQTFAYDIAARLDRVTTVNNGAYTRYVYGPFWTQSFSTVNTIADEAYSITVFDGVGRPFGTAGNHPGSVGGYRLAVTIYDLMGRAVLQTRPFEVDNSWTAAGDDAGGVPPTTQSYDWQGRPLRTTHPDGFYKDASYAGCGCAGGEVVTLTDEVGRRQKAYSDVLGRSWKTEILNWDGSVYSTSTNTFNPRDQATLIRQYAGTDQSSTYQDTTMGYDGYGRLQTKHVPEQNAGTATVYAYNSDDTIQSVTDARGASASYTYNNGRHLVNEIHYSAPSGIAPTSNVTFGYDAAGNRTSMIDGTGSTSYGYDQLSRLTLETRYFGAPLSRSYNLSYEYNLANQLASISMPDRAQQVGYNHDVAGRLNSVTASGFANTHYEGVYPNWYPVTTPIGTLASNISYRAWGAVKQMTYGNGVQLSMSYNGRQAAKRYEVNNFNVSGSMGSTYSYHDDGRVNFAGSLSDNRFDRKYVQDHAAQLKEALSGDEARGGTTPDGPFKQEYTYDAWQNVTGRSGRVWSTNQQESVSYTNNRRQGWQYDAIGHALSSADGNHTFDAAGRQKTFSGGSLYYQNIPQLEVTQEYSGDALPVKRVDLRRTEDFETQAITTTTTNTYYLRSTVLGGQAIAELDAQGNKTAGYVYLEQMQLAKQIFITYPSNHYVVHWQHTDPVTGSSFSTGVAREVFAQQELDPLGVDVTTPPEPQVFEEPSYLNPHINYFWPLEAPAIRTSELEIGMADYEGRLGNTRDTIAARDAWRRGDRATWENILHRNPNVGISVSISGFGLDGTRTGTLWGSQAAAFLGGLTQLIDSGTLVQQGESSRRYAHAPQEPAGGTFATVIDLPGASPNEYLLRESDIFEKGRYGDGDCAQMAQILAEQQGTPMGLAGSGRWRQGDAVMGNRNLRRGTVIASGWDSNGYYPNASRGNHVAIFLSFITGGISVLEQTRDGGVNIRDVTDATGGYFRNPNAFRVVLSGYPPVPGVPARRSSVCE